MAKHKAIQVVRRVRAKTAAIGKASGADQGSDTRFKTAQAVRKKLGRRLGARK